MVNIAFPYKEADASAMEMALDVLQMMAEKGNAYIRACHSLLTKIRSIIKPKDHSKAGNADEVGEQQVPESSEIMPGLPQDENQPFTFDFEGDPALWAEVLESIDIDMDRQWVETALRRGQQLDA